MLSERLKSLRLEAKITQKEISNKLEIGQGTYARYEKGDRKPTGEILNDLAKFFNVSTDYLLGNTDIKSKNLETDLNKTLDTVKSFDGKPITDSDRETIREILKRRQREREQKENK
ncbi:helix-turn-helix domain-containing protein [Lactococcus raffinolactis]|uniref:Helix-turn-helix domain-containing protein n=1 Tax=Pseudolactococcus raffinolactis TaxID=1366 RepID=A0A6H0UBB0_9LACT|nr:helix-turn-helix transcriptional regulator [Lactococcus raffinolactis]QIW52828.1 helix-turn-helix domain-containing protein [Lactococcus raffinolactis]